MSKRRKGQNNNNPSNLSTSSLSVNIDYEKLAETFLKIQKHQEEKIEETNNKPNFFKSIVLIMNGKKDTKDHMTIGLMSIPLVMLFKSFSILGFISIFVGIYTIYKQVIVMPWSIGFKILENIIMIGIEVFSLFFLLTFSIIVWGASNEIEKSEDKYFVIAVFSGIVSFVALVVALVALKG